MLLVKYNPGDNNMTSFSTLRVLAISDKQVFAEAIKDFGLEVIGFKNNDPLNKKVQVESIVAMASAITEDADDNVDIPAEVIAAKRLAEDLGYIVRLVEGYDDIESGGTITKPVTRPNPGTKPGQRPKPRPKSTPFNPPKPSENPAPKAGKRPFSNPARPAALPK